MLPLRNRLIGCVLAVGLGLLLVVYPHPFTSTLHSASEVELAGWLCVVVFSSAFVLQAFQGLKARKHRPRGPLS